MADAVSICNSALIKLGAPSITSLAEDSHAAKLCNEQYEKVRQDLIYSHPWNFAMKRATWTENGNTPAWGFEFEFTLPADFIRIIELDYADIEYQLEGGVLVSNESTINVLYLYDETDADKYSKGFLELFSLKLAAELSHALVQSATLKQTLMAEYSEKLRDVRDRKSVV